MEKWIELILAIIFCCGCTHKAKNDVIAKPIPRALVAKSFDGAIVTSWLYPHATDQNKGLVVYLHGGPHISVKDDMPAVIEFFQKNGYNVLGVDYRGSRGYGAEFQNVIKGDLGRLEVQDIYASLKMFLSENPDLAKKPVYLSGHSYGGFLALLIAVDSHNPFRKVVAMAAPADLSSVLASMKKCPLPACKDAGREMRDDIYGNGISASYLSGISPLKKSSRITALVYVVQGALDPFVPTVLTKKFVSAAKKNGKNVRSLILPGVGHDLGAVETPEAFMASLLPISNFLNEQ